jgi:hypothetical protein
MLNEEHVLSEAAVNALWPLVRIAPSPAPPLAEETLISFLMGTTTEIERVDTIAALVCSSDLRERLVDLDGQVKRLTGAPLGSLPQEAFSPALLERFGMCLHRSLEVFGQTRELLIQHGWAEVGRNDGLYALRSVLASAGQALKNSLSGPRFATVRGPRGGVEQAEDISAGLGASLDVWLGVNGDLQAEASIIERTQGAAESVQGRTLFLNLIDPAGGMLPLAEQVADGETLEFSVPDFLNVTGLPESYVANEFFHVGLEADYPRGKALSPNRLFAETTPSSGVPAVFEILDLPLVEDGHLAFTLIASETLRRRFSEHRLELSIPVGNRMQVLGTWPLSEWNEDSRSFRIAVPDARAGRFGCGSVLHARLVRL